MFGAWGSTSNTNTANNPSQPSTGGFGTPNAFGQPAQNTGGFGAFGQPQQQQQPSTGFGTTTQSTGFGGFGGGAGGFGAKPATGFGGTGTFGSNTGSTGGFGSGFGSNAGTSTTFGQPSANTPSTTGFGGGFGSNTNTTNAWGKPAATTGFGAGAQTNQPPQGTANPVFSEVTERDSGAANVTLHYHSISCMPAYIKYSPEELRVQDYSVGRKNAQSNVPAPQAGGFGATTPATTGFGSTASTGAFGQTAQNATGGFGSGFGTTTGTGTGGLFGNTGTGGFGSLGSNTGAGTSTFGQSSTTASNPFAPSSNTGSGFGAFGSNPNTNTSTSTGFGANANANANKPFGTFGTSTASTGGGFGTGPFGSNTPSSNTATNAFGQPSTSTTTGFGSFGQNAATKPSGFGTGFGTNTTNPSPFGQQNTTSSAFGQPAQPTTGGLGTTPGTSGFGFGQQNQAQTTNPFGQPTQGTNTANPFGNAFGQPANNQQPGTNTATGGAGNLFGQNKPTGTNTGFGSFGQPPATSTTGTTPAFGLGTNATNNTGLFGQNSTATSNTGLFGTPGGTGLFRNASTAPNTFGGLGTTNTGLGSTQTTNPATSTAPNPFGNFSSFAQQPAAANNTTTTNLFSSTAQPQQQQQPSLTASVDQPFNSSIPVFELLPGAAAAAGSLAASALSKKKAPNFFQARKPLPSAKLAATMTSSTSNPNLRGFSTSTNGKAGLQGLTQMMRGGTNHHTTSSSLGASSFLGGTLSDKKALNSEVFASSPGRVSVKKLILDKEVTGDELSSILAKGNKKSTGNALELLRGSPSSAPPPKAKPAPLPAPASREQTHSESEKLEKGDYWVQPSESQLRATAFRDLEKLEGFKCGRVGYGTVEFLDPVNLTTLGDVKEIPGKFIIFDERECTVYPDEHDKPPVGQGLNVRARITLENCWATDRATREPIKDESHPRNAAHLKKLKNMPNTTFENFDIQTGEWTFVVEHFSRYGLGGDDDEDEELDAQQEQQQQQPSVVPVPALISVDHSMEHTEDESMDDASQMRASVRPRDVSMRRSKEPSHAFRRRSMSRPPRPGEENDADNDDDTEMEVSPDRARHSWVAQLGMDPRRVAQMQSGLFSGSGRASKTPGVAKALIKPSARAPTPSALGKHPRESSIMDEDSDAARIRRGASIERSSFAEQHERQLVFEPPARKFVRVVRDSLVEGKEELYRDAGLAFGRSFRVGWGPGGALVHLGAICGPYDQIELPESLSTITITKVSTTTLQEKEAKQVNTDQLKTYIENVEVIAPNGIPKVVPSDRLLFEPFASLLSQQDKSFAAQLWRLASALFDPIPLDVNGEIDIQKQAWISNLRRKMRISDWLKSAVAHSVEQVMLDGSATPIAQVFALLTGNQVQRACEVAMDAGDFHLATLLSQIGGDRRFRETMWRQWDTWSREGSDVFIDEDYRKVYAILAGEVTRASASQSQDPALRLPELDITKGLGWMRSFALHFWYNCRLEDPAASAIDVYNEATFLGADADGVIPFNPTPWYIQPEGERRFGLYHDGDALLHLLRLFNDPTYSLADTFSPRCFTPHRLDYRLPWQLYAVYSSLRLQTSSGLDDPEMLGDYLTVAYAMQLEVEEAIDSAVFVLLHLSDNSCRAEAIRSILLRNAHLLNDMVEHNLRTFKLPKPWVAAAKAAYARYTGRPYAAYKLYLEANEQKFACDIAIADLAPDAIIRHDLPFLKDLFISFNPEKIDDWGIRGKLFLDYVDISREIQALMDAIARQPGALPTKEQTSRADRVFSTIPSLLRLLPPILGVDQGTTHGAHSLQSKRHKAALDEVITSLVYAASPLQTLLMRKPNVKLDLRGVEPGARLQVVQSAAYDRFCSSLEVL